MCELDETKECNGCGECLPWGECEQVQEQENDD